MTKFNVFGLEMLVISLESQNILLVCRVLLPLCSKQPFHSSRLCANAVEAQRDHYHQEFLNRWLFGKWSREGRWDMKWCKPAVTQLSVCSLESEAFAEAVLGGFWEIARKKWKQSADCFTKVFHTIFLASEKLPFQIVFGFEIQWVTSI